MEIAAAALSSFFGFFSEEKNTAVPQSVASSRFVGFQLFTLETLHNLRYAERILFQITGLGGGQKGLGSWESSDTGRTALLQPRCDQQLWNARETKVLRLARTSEHQEKPPRSPVSDPPGAPPPGS